MKRLPFAALLLLFLLPFFTVQACGPDFAPDVFIQKLGPDDSAQFAAGKLGILLPTYPRADLTVAFRYLNGGTLNPAERAAYTPIPTRLQLENQEAVRPVKIEIPPLQLWLNLRAQYVTAQLASPSTVAIDQQTNLKITDPVSKVTVDTDYLNCSDDAFHTAVLTLNSRAKTWGATSPLLADWLRAQDAVFANCRADSVTLPAPAPASAPPLLRADRAYQLAAAHFYASQFDDARAAFDDIARDSASPWQPLAGYLAARTLVRQAFLISQPGADLSGATFNPDLMRQAQTRLQALVADKSPNLPRPAIHNLLDLVRIRLDPTARLHELSTALAGPQADPRFQQHLRDLTWFLDISVSSQ